MTSEEIQEAPLSIGSVVGGTSPSTQQWREGITRLTRRVAESRAGITSPLNVNVIFQVPGNILKPDFEGVRTGSFSRKDSWLIVQVALPEEPPSDIEADLKKRTLAAIEAAEQWARQRRIADGLPQLRQLSQSL